MTFDKIFELTKEVMPKFKETEEKAKEEGQKIISCINDIINLSELTLQPQNIIFRDGFLKDRECNISRVPALQKSYKRIYLYDSKSKEGEEAINKEFKKEKEELIAKGESPYSVRIENKALIGGVTLFINAAQELRIGNLSTVEHDDNYKFLPNGYSVDFYRSGNVREEIVHQTFDENTEATYTIRNNEDIGVSDISATIYKDKAGHRIKMVLDNDAKKIIKADYFILRDGWFRHISNLTDDKQVLNELNYAIFGREIRFDIASGMHRLDIGISNREMQNRSL